MTRKKYMGTRIWSALPALVLCLLFVMCFIVSIPLKHRTKRRSNLEPFEEGSTRIIDSQLKDPMHFYIVIHRLKVLNKVLTMLKSLLYYHGHFNSSLSKECTLEWNTPSGVLCRTSGSFQHPQPINLHLVVHKNAWNKTVRLFQIWNSSSIHVKIYQFKTELVLRGTEVEKSPRVQLALQKLLAPYILDQSVEKVILLDPNLLFNDDVANLWAIFKSFSDTQIIGATCEQVDDCNQCCPRAEDEFPLYGLNVGLMLLNLKRMRQLNWRNLYKAELSSIQYFHEAPGDLSQGIINTILSKRIRLLHRLPCEWNVQAHTQDGLKSCPIHWINQKPEESLCSHLENENSNMLRTVQYDIFQIVDLTVEEDEDSEQEIIDNHIRPMASVNQLRAQFHYTYNKFQNLPLECFV